MNKLARLLFLSVLMGINLISNAQMDYSPNFKAGRPAEMEKLSFLEGEWNITLKWTNDLNSDTSEWHLIGNSKSVFIKMYDGTFVMEKSEGFPIKNGHEGFSSWEYTSIYSYDRFQEKYRYVAFDNILALADIYEGGFTNNKLVFSNQSTSTYNNHGTNQSAQKNKFYFNQLTDSSFEITWFNIDQSKILPENPDNSEWNFAIHMLYEKQ